MSMTNGEDSWRVVGKTSKQKQKDQPMNKNQRKAFIENMPKLKKNDPLKDTSTMFDAFIKKHEKEDTKVIPAQPTKIPALPTTKKAGEKKKKPAPPVVKKKPKMTFDEAVKKIQRKNLETTLDNCRMHFPTNPDVWMKDIASLLNIAMDTVPDPDPLYKGKAAGYPHSELNAGCQSFLRTLMADTEKETLTHMFYYCIQVINSEINKGNPTHGYHMFIQSIALYYPDVIANKTQQYIEMVKSNHHKPANALTVLWAIGQCGLHNMQRGLRIWLDVMLPFLTVKHLASYVVLYLEHVLRGDVTKAYNVMSLRDFFPLLDLIFGNNPNVQTDLKTRLANSYPKLKQITIKDQPEKTLHLFFPSFLSRLSPNTSGALRAELLSSLICCLSQDPQSISVWRQMYTKHLPQSAVLLSYISQRLPDVKRGVGDDVVMATLQSFDVTNDELIARGNMDPEKSGCARICKNLLKKKVQPKMSWFWLLPATCVVVAMIVAYDVYSAKTFQASRTIQFMKEYGILSLGQKVYGMSRHYTHLTVTWLKKNVPAYCEYAYVTIVPYLYVAAERSKQAFIHAVEVTGPHRDYVVRTARNAYESIYEWSPEFWASVPVYFWWTIDTLRGYLTLLFQYTIQAAAACSVWLNDHLFRGETGSVGDVLSTVRSMIHEQMLRTYEWCNAVIASWK